MKINFSLISEDYLHFPISNKNKEIMDNLEKHDKNMEIKNETIKKIIREEIKNNYLFLKNINKEDYYDMKIYKRDSNNKKELNIKNDYDYIIDIKSKDNLKNEFEQKINSCIEKEKILLEKQNEFKNKCDNIKIDEKLLEKKLLTLIEINNEEYEKLIEKIISKILDYDNYMKEVAEIEERLIKYRDSLIIGYCFKIYGKKLVKVILYLVSKNIIFLNNDNLFKMVNNIYLRIIKKIIDEMYDHILQKISNNDIFKNHQTEYEQNLNFYREICYLFPILKYFESEQEKEIFEFKEDINLEFSEYTFDQIMRVNSHIPKRNGLNITLAYFKEHTNIEQAYAMSLRRILLITQKYKVLFPTFKRSSFLYE